MTFSGSALSLFLFGVTIGLVNTLAQWGVSWALGRLAKRARRKATEEFFRRAAKQSVPIQRSSVAVQFTPCGECDACRAANVPRPS